MKRPTIFAILFLLAIIAANLLTPSTWQWRTNNLQVRLHNLGNERRNEGSFGQGVGWSKLSLFTFDWWRKSTSTGTSGNTTITSSSVYNIAGVSPRGVTVRVRYQQTRNQVPTSFDQRIFIPTHGVARVDISPDFYLTGSFE